MVACESCLRSNPPTRLQCMYCGGSLPFNNAAFDLQKPDLRPLENWEQGYNNILKSSPATKLSDEAVALAANLLKLDKIGRASCRKECRSRWWLEHEKR